MFLNLPQLDEFIDINDVIISQYFCLKLTCVWAIKRDMVFTQTLLLPLSWAYLDFQWKSFLDTFNDRWRQHIMSKELHFVICLQINVSQNSGVSQQNTTQWKFRFQPLGAPRSNMLTGKKNLIFQSLGERERGGGDFFLSRGLGWEITKVCLCNINYLFPPLHPQASIPQPHPPLPFPDNKWINE